MIRILKQSLRKLNVLLWWRRLTVMYPMSF
ncbi:Protein of unknown function [Gryllus bimaculatus]|nr:Protein of unknown function [Gryllus bimaculatus]